MTSRVLDPTIVTVIRDTARRVPDREALVDDDRRITYAQLEAEMMQIARAAIAIGVRPGDRVAIWAPNSVTCLTLFSGLLAAGAAVAPINTRFKGDEGAIALRRNAATLLFTVGGFLGVDYVSMLRGTDTEPSSTPIVTLDGSHAGETGVTTWQDFLRCGDATEDAVVRQRIADGDPAGCAFVILTSGTTGEPKGVALSHRASLQAAQALIDRLGMLDGDHLLVVLPFFHVFGIFFGFEAGMALGARLVISSVFDPGRVMALIESERITVLPGPPTIHEAILDAPDRAAHDLSSLRLAFIASTSLPPGVVHRIVDEGLAPHVTTGYGLTEAGGTVALSRAGAPIAEVAEWAGEILPGVELKVVDAAGEELPHGEAGELLVRTPLIMDGYVGDPEATAAAIDGNGWLHTGDVGIRDAEGHVRVTDRKKDMYIVGGFNAYPAEIERMLLMHPAIAQVAVVGMPDPRLGEVGAAYVVSADANVTSVEIIAWARERMANYKVPRHVELVDSLPLTPSMKVYKEPLRRRALEAAANLTSASV